MYAAFSRREQAVNMLEVRAGDPPNPYDMLTRFNRIHGLDKLAELWKTWEIWFADVEESHTTLPALAGGVGCGKVHTRTRFVTRFGHHWQDKKPHLRAG